MISLVFRLKAKRRDARRVAVALQSVLQPAQLDRGCVSCGLMAEVGAPEHLLYFEEWASEGVFKTQLRSPRFTQLLSLLETATETPRVEIRTIGPPRGLDYIKELLLEDDSTAAANDRGYL